MKVIKKQQFLLPFDNINSQYCSGFTIILVVLIISSIISLVLLSTVWGSIMELEGAEIVRDGIKTSYGVEGCMDEALLQLKRDSNYIGGTLSLEEISCIISVTGSSDERNIIVNGTSQGYNKIIEVQVSLNPFAIIFWQ